ncbi:transposase [Marinobacter sp. C18]|uniref:transposase n=1 Tax=Marinobacter sp. C18 TaxID=1772288 RepID=UPI002117044F|nr:transposase [Marinobacter sp. C18]
MEACSGARYWARQLTRLGHNARIIAPCFDASYRKSSKNDDNDAEAICKAADRPTYASRPSPGIGPRTAAAILACAPDPRQLKCGRHFAAVRRIIDNRESTAMLLMANKIRQSTEYVRATVQPFPDFQIL